MSYYVDNFQYNQEKIRKDGFGKLAMLPDKFICKMFLIFCDESIVAILNLSIVSKAFYQVSLWPKFWRRLTLNITAGDFEYDTSWKQTFINSFLNYRKQKKELETGILIPKSQAVSPRIPSSNYYDDILLVVLYNNIL